MTDYIVYSSPNCKWCDEAKSLLTREGLTFEVRDISEDAHRETIVSMGLRTVPQIFVATENGSLGDRVGGYYDLRDWLRGDSD